MIKLKDGFEIVGTIENSIVDISNEWTKIIVVETNLSLQEAQRLFVDNDEYSCGETVYRTSEYIKSVQESGKTYTWLKHRYSYQKKSYDAEIDDLTNYVLEVDMKLASMELGITI